MKLKRKEAMHDVKSPPLSGDEAKKAADAMFPGYLTIVRHIMKRKKKKKGISSRSIHREKEFYNWEFENDGREAIREWSRSRIQKMRGLNKSYYGCLVYTFHMNTLKSFVENFNFMVILQMLIAGVGVYLFDHYDIYYSFQAALFVSPIVFPLAFSINTDFQRREKVLDDLANFKSSSMLWFFCMREWRRSAGLEDSWMNEIQKKTHSIMFNLREYLLTSRPDRRNIIARYMYEDYSDTSQLIEQLRDSKLPSNPALISRAYHLLNQLCLSFERLRVIREYRSPRSIRSLNKVLVLLLPIILCPYFVSLSRAPGASQWGPYFIAIMVAAVFGALQGVQDKLDDPFDGMSEDDINLDTIDEWTFNSLESASKRHCSEYGRFLVCEAEGKGTANNKKESKTNLAPPDSGEDIKPMSPNSIRSKSIVEFLKEMEGEDTIRKSALKNRKRSKSIFKHLSRKARKQVSVDKDEQNLLIDVKLESETPTSNQSLRECKVSFSNDMVTYSNNENDYMGDDDVIINGSKAVEQPLPPANNQQGVEQPSVDAVEGDGSVVPELSPPQKRNDDTLIKLNAGVAVTIKDSPQNNSVSSENNDIAENLENDPDVFQEVIVVT